VESGIMPKVLVLFFGDDDSRMLVEAAASGAKGVRFTEVDVRAASETSASYQPLGADHRFTDYDGVVLVSGTRERSMDTSTTLSALRTEAASKANLSNVVIAVLGSNDALLDWAARSGGILVTQAGLRGSGNATDAQEHAAHAAVLGARIAKVAGWVRHALGHEAEHEANHHADHEHAHAHAQSDQHHH
jgi:hypothetical protein